MEDKHWEYKRQVKETKERNHKFQQEHSKRQLKRNIESKFNTAIIGAIVRFENNFGHLWGHGKYDDELTDKERKWLEVWKKTRSEVLDYGHDQSRASKHEIDMYTVDFERYNYEFINKEELVKDE